MSTDNVCCKNERSFQQKYWQISDINILNLNDTLTNDVVSFDQLGPDVQTGSSLLYAC